MYRLEVTDDDANILHVANFPDSTARGELIHRYMVDAEQADFAFEVISQSGSTFDLCIIESIAGENKIVWTARLSRVLQ